jgi:hypothetical protein
LILAELFLQAAEANSVVYVHVLQPSKDNKSILQQLRQYLFSLCKLVKFRISFTKHLKREIQRQMPSVEVGPLLFADLFKQFYR